MQNCPRLRHSRALFRLTAAVLLSLVLPWAAAAQQDAGTLRVLVQDSTGVVPGAEVIATNAATNVAMTQVSNEQGYATFSPIQRGTYTVNVSLTGFSPVRVTNVTIVVSQNRLLPVTLTLANIAETIQVVAQAAVIQTEYRRPQPARAGLAGRQREFARDEQLPARWLR